MVLTTLIILILVGCFINGHRRGLIMMALYSATYFVSWLIARVAAPVVANWLVNLLPNVADNASYSGRLLAAVDLNDFFSRGIAFIVVFSLASFLCHWIVRQFRWVKRVPIIGTADRWLGGALSFLIGYVIIFLVLIITQLWPAEWWQMQIANSGLARLIINQTPILAQLVLHAIG